MSNYIPYKMLDAITFPCPMKPGMVGVTVALALSAQSAVHSRYLTVYFLQRTQKAHPMVHPKGRGVFSEFILT